MPGSGTATISPAANVTVGALGTWTVTYTSVDTFSNGTVRVTIPASWTAPQDVSSTGAGYVTVSSSDGDANPLLSISGRQLTISLTQVDSAATVTVVYGDDSGGANPGARAVAQTSPESSVEFTVESDPLGSSPSAIGTSPTVNVLAGPVAGIDVSPGDTTITAGDFSTFVIGVIDAYGNRTPTPALRTIALSSAPSGQFFLTSDHGTPVANIVIPINAESILVDYQNTNANDGVAQMIFLFNTDAESPGVFVTTDVTVNPGPVSLIASTVTAETPVVANGIATSTVTVTVTDTFLNPLSGISVSLAASSVSGQASATNPGPTGVDGMAVGTVTNTVAEVVTVVALAGIEMLVETADVTFVSGPVHGLTSEVAGTTPVVADGVATSTVMVTAKDSLGNVVSGASVVLSVSPGGGGVVVTQPGGVTDGSGQVTGTVRSNTAGARAVHAVVNGVSVVDSAVVDFVAGQVASFVWTVDGVGVAGELDDVTMRVEDAFGNTALGYADTVFVSTTKSGGREVWALGVGAQGVLDSLSNGQWFYVFNAADSGDVALRVSVTKAESVTLSGDRGVASGVSTAIAVDHAAADRVSVVSGEAQSAEVASAVSSSLVVRVRDTFGNAVDGEAVRFGMVTGGGSVDVVAGGVVDSVATTDATGEAVCEEWVLGTVSGTNTVEARIGGGGVPFVVMTGTGTPGTGVNVTLSPGSKNVTVGSGEVVSAVLRDQYLNVVPGKRVDLLIGDQVADGSLENDPASPTTAINATARFGTTDSTGSVRVIYRAPNIAALVDSVDAFGDGATRGDVSDVEYTSVVGLTPTDLRIVFVGSDSSRAGESFEFRLEAVDGNGNVVTSDVSVVNLLGEVGGGLEFSESDFGVAVTQVTLVGGGKTVYGRGQWVGDWQLTARDNASVLGDGVGSVRIDDSGVVDHYVVTTVDSVVAGVSFNVTVVARDTFGNVVSGGANAVSLVAVDAADSSLVLTDTLLVGSSALSAGQVVVGETYLHAQTIRVRVRDGSGNEGYSGNVKVKAALAYRLVYVNGDTTGVLVGTLVPLDARVVDLYDNPVVGEPVVFSVLSGGGSVVPPSLMSDGGGLVRVTLTTGVVAGENRVRAVIGDANPPGLESVEYSAQTTAGLIAYYEVIPAKTLWSAGEGVSVEVRAYDASDNLVVEDSTTSVTLGSDTGNAQYLVGVGTLVGGVYGTSVADAVVEQVVLTVTDGSPAAGASDTVRVVPDVAYEVVKVRGDTTGVVVGSTMDLEVEVLDTFGNLVPNQPVVFAILSDLGGTAILRDAVNDSTDGITITDAVGRATVRLTSADAVGDNIVRASILDGNPPSEETEIFTVSTISGTIAYYTVTVDTIEQTAGIPVGITVRSFIVRDAFGNPIGGVTVNVNASGGNANVTNPAGPTGVDGMAVGTVTNTVAEVVTVVALAGIEMLVETADVTFVSGPVHGLTSEVAGDTITAGGVLTTTITTDPFVDQFGNVAPAGTLIRVSASTGTIDSPDQDPATPATNEQRTDSSGRVAFVLRSSITPGTSNVTALSVQGSASAALNIVFAQPAVFACTELPFPQYVVPEDSVQFDVVLENTSPTDVTIQGGTTLEFFDGTRLFTVTLSVPLFLQALSSDTLRFRRELIAAQFAPGGYQPVLNLSGVDEYGAAFTSLCLLPPNSVSVMAVQLTAIAASPLVSRGALETVGVGITNPGADSVIVTALTLSFSGGTYAQGPLSSLPDTLLPGETHVLSVPVTIDPGSALGTFTIDAAVTATTGGVVVGDNSLAPNPLGQWTVQASASVSYVAGSLTESIVSQGQSQALEIRVANSGQATVTFDADSTTISFMDGTNVFLASLDQNTALAGSATGILVFDPMVVPPTFAAGTYDVRVDLGGLENGGLFSGLLNTSDQGDSITVVALAVVTVVPATLSPDSVSKSTSVAFRVRVSTPIGAADVVLNADSTTFSFASGSYLAALDPNFNTVITPGLTDLMFRSETVSGSITSQDYFPTVTIVGSENGVPLNQPFTLIDTLTVQDAPDLSIVSIETSPLKMTADQAPSIDVWMYVQNNGQATVRLDSAKVRFVLGGADRTGEFVLSVPSGFTGGPNLAGSDRDSILFVVSDDTNNAMSTGVLTIEGDLWVTDLNNSDSIQTNTNLGGKGSLVVQSPANIVIESIVSTQNPVTVNQTAPFEIRMALRNDGESDVSISFDTLTTLLAFDQGIWVRTLRTTLAGGDSLLGGGEQDTVVFDVSQAGGSAGPVRIDGSVAGIELNSGRTEADDTAGSGEGSVFVQFPADLVVTSIRTTQATVTAAQTAQWDAIVHLENQGEADIDVAFNAGTPTLRMSPDSGFSITRRVLISNGGTLSAGETDSLLFSITVTGTSAGYALLHASIEGTALNTGAVQVFDTEIQGSGYDSVLVQMPPHIVVDSAFVVAPGAPDVNLNQIFKVAARVRNIGEADAKNVRFVMMAPGTSIPQPPDTLTVASLASGASMIDTFMVRASSSVTGPDTVHIAVVAATDMNSGQTDLATYGPSPDSLAVLRVVNLGVLSVTTVTPSQASVTRQQIQPWTITAVVENAGDAPVQLNAVSATVDFSIGGGPSLLDYVVVAPDTFLSGAPLLLSGGATDSLLYRVTTTGVDTGSVDIQVSLSGVDQYDLGVRNGAGAGTVIVESESGLFILATLANPASAPNNPQPNLVRVDEGWMFQVEVTLQNTGEDVDSVRVVLVSDSTSVVSVADTADVEIAKDAAFTFVFDVTASTLLGGEQARQEILSASIVKAISRNSGQPVSASVPADNDEVIAIQRPADLRVRLEVSAPPEAIDGVIGVGQTFTVEATVRNDGVGQVDESASELTLSLPPGFSFEPATPDSTSGFTLGSPVSWTVRARPDSASNQVLTVAVSTLPIALNTNQAALGSPVDTSITVDIKDVAAFSVPTLTLVAPSGALDDTLSTDQPFTSEATVTAPATMRNVVAILKLASGSGMSAVSADTVSLGDGDGGVKTVSFSIQTSTVAGADSFHVQFEGTDVNSGNTVGMSTPTYAIDVVPASRISLSTAITTPQAQDNTVTLGAPFTVKGVVDLSPAVAGIDTTAAKPRVRMTLPVDYSFDIASPPATQGFALGDSVTWIIRAPVFESGPKNITVEIISAPADENSGLLASLLNNPSVIPIQTETFTVSVTNESVAQGLNTQTVPQGARDIDILAVSIRNPLSGADSILVNWIDVTLLDENGNPVSNPAAALSELYVDAGGTRVDANLTQNPMRLPIELIAGPAAVVQQADSLLLVFTVSVSGSVPLSGFSIAIRDSGDVFIRNALSGGRANLVPGDFASDALRSNTVTILGGTFEEFAHNYPNPFSPKRDGATKIAYNVGATARVNIRIFDLTGKLVWERSYNPGEPEAVPGPREVEWTGVNMKGESVRNGIYVCRIEVGGNSATFKIAVAK